MAAPDQPQLSFDLKTKRPTGNRRVTPPTRQRVYFAIRPEPQAALAAAGLGQAVYARHRLAGNLYTPERLHISLCAVDWVVELREDIVFAAMQAAAQIEMPGFSVCFDRISPFNDGDTGAVVLRCSDGDMALRDLAAALFTAMRDLGWQPPHRRNFTPHMTLYRGRHAAPESRLIRPIRWHVEDFVLVHSGGGRQDNVSRWPLSPPA